MRARAGSSPRVRGTRLSQPQKWIRIGFIPARAGNTWRQILVFPLSSGSSPRVRGTLVVPEIHFQLQRFIPARAGNTPAGPFCSPGAPVHPRACGEHISVTNTATLCVGSSPRVRGTPCCIVSSKLAIRFIPARAGNTRQRCVPAKGRPVHPRACGEHPHARSITDEGYGSSPRVRGTLHSVAPDINRLRFIPARAGNTLQFPHARTYWTVHPRACGEHHAARAGVD